MIKQDSIFHTDYCNCTRKKAKKDGQQIYFQKPFACNQKDKLTKQHVHSAYQDLVLVIRVLCLLDLCWISYRLI